MARLKSAWTLTIVVSTSLAMPFALAAGEADFDLTAAVQKTTDGQQEISKTLVPSAQAPCHTQDKAESILQPAPKETQNYLGCKPSKSPLFSSDSVLEITVRGYAPDKIVRVSHGRKPSTEERNVKPSLEIEYEFNGAKKSLATKVESRGKSRAGFCDFKPLRILLDPNQDRTGSIVDHLKGDDLKLTVHCKYTSGKIADHPAENEDVIKEYFAYQALKAAGYVTPETRLAKVTYLDPNGGFVTEGYGFFIEPKKDLAHRCNTKHIKSEDADKFINEMDKKNLIPFYFAEKLIDGSDWVPNYAHNTIPLARDGRVIAAAPYDFNDTGMINARNDGRYGVQTLTVQEWKNLILRGPYNREGESDSISAKEQKTWKAAVIAEAKRALSRKEDVMQALARAPFKDKELFQSYFESHFKALSELVRENP